MKSAYRIQHGVTMIESLVAILLFSIGILALVAMYASSVSATTDAQYRTEAANYANRIVGRIWSDADRVTGSGGNFQTSLTSFALNTTGADCNFSGGATGSDPGKSVVQAWADAIKAAGSGLPGAKDAFLQVKVDTAAADFNRVTVTVCWQAPADTVPRRHVLVANVN